MTEDNGENLFELIDDQWLSSDTDDDGGGGGGGEIDRRYRMIRKRSLSKSFMPQISMNAWNFRIRQILINSRVN